MYISDNDEITCHSMTDNPGVGEVLKEMPDDQVADSLRKLCYLQVQHLNQVSFPYNSNQLYTV